MVGTRADFYVGRGPKARWLGSIAFNGDPDSLRSVNARILRAKTLPTFEKHVGLELGRRDDATTPEQGWPWPWRDSSTTDYAYAYDRGRVWYSCFGSKWRTVGRPLGDDEPLHVVDFPDMTHLQKVTFGARSGIMLIRM